MSTVNVKRPLNIESKRVRKWFANGTEVLAESSPGRFQVVYQLRNRDQLAELHAVLGQALTDLANEPAPSDEEPESPL